MMLTSIVQRCVVHWGEFGSRWGINRSVARIHALLSLASQPLHVDEIAETLGITRSNVRVGLKELLAWDLVQMTHTLGARELFQAPHHPWEVIRIVVSRREMDSTVAFLRDCTAELQKDTETPTEVRARIVAQMEFFDTLMLILNLSPRSPAPPMKAGSFDTF